MSYRYPVNAIFWDYARGGAGALVFLVPAAVFDLPRVTLWVCILLGMLFVFYLGQTVVRHRTHIDMDDRMIRNHADARCFAWSDLSEVALRYFSVQRDGGAGWLELRLSAENQSLRVDSRIEGFDRIAAQAARAAAENGLRLDRATLSNFDALGIQCSESLTQRD